MPVRIYEIAKNLGVQSKDVLAKAKDLNITNAKVASSSLDKITAEYLEEQLAKDLKPAEPEAPAATETVPTEEAPSGPVLIVAEEPEVLEAEIPAEETETEESEASEETETEESKPQRKLKKQKRQPEGKPKHPSRKLRQPSPKHPLARRLANKSAS